MIYDRYESAQTAALHVAKQMVAAAITAPKANGLDNVDAMVLTDDEKDNLADKMREIGHETDAEFIVRDAGNVDNSECIVLVAVKNAPIILDGCGFCGLGNCANNIEVGAHCVFNSVDLGIAIGSAVSIAADNRIDNRVMFSAGKAAIELGFFPDDYTVAFGIPLSVHSKSNFFDRGPGAVLF